MADGFADRLADELGDATLAEALAERITIDTQTALLGSSHPLALAIRPPTVPSERVDALVVFAFGNRIDADGTLEPGPVNERLADITAAFVAEHPVPVFAQWEVADLLAHRGVADVVSIGAIVADDGTVTYLSTAGVAEQAVELARASGRPLETVGVIAVADHAVRCVLTCRAAGMTTVAVPAGLSLPTEYDADSGQPWTRSRLDYLAVDLAVRLPLLGTR